MQNEAVDHPKIPLFPAYAKYIGYGLILTGLVAGYFYFFGGRPAFFEGKVYAIVSAYVDTRYFAIIQTNLLDEIAAVGIISGLCLVCFSKEKNESEQLLSIRLKALVLAIYSSVFLWILIYFLIYGYFIIVLLPLIFIVFLILYKVIFIFSLHFGGRSK
jgi:hypothetical protein